MKRLLTNASILSWKEEDFAPIPCGCIGIDGDTIVYVGETLPADQGTYDEIKAMTGKILMPGLVNSHCHAPMVLLRGQGSDLPLQEWLFDKMIPVEDRMTDEDVEAGYLLAAMEMIASGTTSVTDMYMKPELFIRANEQIGMKINVNRPVQCFDESEKAEDNFRIREGIDLYQRYNGAQQGRVKVDFAIHAEYTNKPLCVKGMAEMIRPYVEQGAVMHLHLSETETEHNECIAKYGVTPAKWFEDLGIFDMKTTAAHCVYVTEEDREILLRKGVTPVHNPTSNMKLASGFAPIPAMLAQGIPVALGTDGAASNNNLDMFEEMHLAAILHNGYHRDATLMKPAEVVKMATVYGARQQNRMDTGCIAVGKKADIIALETRGQAHLYPNFDLLPTLVYTAQSADVCMTMVDGNILYEDGRFLTLDADEVFQKAKEAVARLYPQ